MPGTSARMLALLSLMQSGREWPGQVLAERLEVATRTIRRDIDRLRELGYSIAVAKGPYGGYRLTPGAELPPMLFDDEQAVAVAVALRTAASSGVMIDEAAARALDTVQQVMPSRLRHRIDSIRFTDSGLPGLVDPEVLETVSVTARDRRTLRFDYGEDQDRMPRHVEPHAVVVRRGRWYLVAWSIDRDAWRLYRVDRIAPRSPAGRPFTPRAIPGGGATAFVAARMKGSEEQDRWPCYAEFRLELPASAVSPWLEDAEIEELSATSCRVRVGSWSWAGALSWIVRLDAPFTVLGPEEFVDALPGFAGRILQAARAPGPAKASG